MCELECLKRKSLFSERFSAFLSWRVGNWFLASPSFLLREWNTHDPHINASTQKEGFSGKKEGDLKFCDFRTRDNQDFCVIFPSANNHHHFLLCPSKTRKEEEEKKKEFQFPGFRGRRRRCCDTKTKTNFATTTKIMMKKVGPFFRSLKYVTAESLSGYKI